MKRIPPTINNAGIAVASSARVGFDGPGGHTYIEEVSDSNLKYYVAGVEMLKDTNDHLYIPDSKNIIMGAGNDLRLWHDGTNTYMYNQISFIQY